MVITCVSAMARPACSEASGGTSPRRVEVRGEIITSRETRLPAGFQKDAAIFTMNHQCRPQKKQGWATRGSGKTRGGWDTRPPLALRSENASENIQLVNFFGNLKVKQNGLLWQYSLGALQLANLWGNITTIIHDKRTDWYDRWLGQRLTSYLAKQL